MDEKTSPEHQAWLREFSKPDPSEKLEHIMSEILTGVAKADSTNIENENDARTWDTLAHQIAEIKARGHMPVYRVDGWD